MALSNTNGVMALARNGREAGAAMRGRTLLLTYIRYGSLEIVLVTFETKIASTDDIAAATLHDDWVIRWSARWSGGPNSSSVDDAETFTA